MKTIDELMSYCGQVCGSHSTVGIHLWQDTGVREPFGADTCGDSGSNFAVTFSTLTGTFFSKNRDLLLSITNIIEILLSINIQQVIK